MSANQGLNILACIGNHATLMSGMAKGVKGVVTGKSGRFSEQVIVHFPAADRERMAIGDKVLIRAVGVGIELPEYPNVKLKGLLARAS